MIRNLTCARVIDDDRVYSTPSGDRVIAWKRIERARKVQCFYYATADIAGTFHPSELTPVLEVQP